MALHFMADELIFAAKADRRLRRQQGRSSFLKKRTKKLLQIMLTALLKRGFLLSKVFCFFFQKRRACFPVW